MRTENEGMKCKTRSLRGWQLAQYRSLAGGRSSCTLREQQILPDSRIVVVDSRSPPMNISVGKEEAKVLHSENGLRSQTPRRKVLIARWRRR